MVDLSYHVLGMICKTIIYLDSLDLFPFGYHMCFIYFSGFCFRSRIRIGDLFPLEVRFLSSAKCFFRPRRGFYWPYLPSWSSRLHGLFGFHVEFFVYYFSRSILYPILYHHRVLFGFNLLITPYSQCIDLSMPSFKATIIIQKQLHITFHSSQRHERR
jgi:hypothetical protein